MTKNTPPVDPRLSEAASAFSVASLKICSRVMELSKTPLPDRVEILKSLRVEIEQLSTLYDKVAAVALYPPTS